MLEELFPGLRGSAWRVTSSVDMNYNCVSWAIGVSDKVWWPDLEKVDHWPRDIPRSSHIDHFALFFDKLGFVPCADEELDSGFEKIALFGVASHVRHVARQLDSIRWTSKLGRLEDIEHELHALEGDEYGRVMLLMRRKQ